MPTLRLHSPAKINLFLHVTGRRSDGYHLLQSVFVPLAWGDRIEFDVQSGQEGVSEDAQIRRQGDFAVPFETDLMVRAAQAFAKATSIPFSLVFGIDKVLPMGGGLGGGSSNAAAILRALQAQFSEPLSPPSLAAMALQLGADVPFFLQPQAAIVEGIGEQITPITLPQWHYVIVCPDIHVPTADIFHSPDLKRDTAVLCHEEVVAQLLQAPPFSDAPDQVQLMGHNDLETVACRLFPTLTEVKKKAWDEAGVHLRMSGSGASFFAVFKTAKAAQSALERLKNVPITWRAAVCTTQG